MNPLLREVPFVPYGASHLSVLVVFILGAWVAAHLGLAQRGTPSAAAFCRRFALVILVFELPLQILGSTPQHWHVARSLPFELCDLAWMVAAIALWTRRRWAEALLYYWGLTLTPQAILTPALRYGFPHIGFFMFWGGHLLVVWAAIYLTWGLGLRPDWRSYRFALAATTGWAALMLLFNTLAGSNYLFVNGKPPVPSLLDLLGPWPWYLAMEFALIACVWALMTWPWTKRPQSP
jgi:hypothetical integral membrane protein (TIGR02206 family)